MHFDQTLAAMDSKIVSGSGNICVGKEADCSFTGVNGHMFGNGSCDDQQYAFGEASKPRSESSGDLYSENAENKAKLTPSVAYNASGDIVKLTTKVSFGKAVGDQLLPDRTDVTVHSLLTSNSQRTSDLPHMTILSRFEEQQVLECHEDVISCSTGFDHVIVPEHCMDLDEKDTIGSTLISFRAIGIKKAVQNEAAQDYHDCEIEGIHKKSSSRSACPVGSLQKDNITTEDSNAGHTRGDSPLGSLENTGPLETEIDTSRVIPSDDMKRSIADEQFEKSSSLLVGTDAPSSKMEPQSMPETDSDNPGTPEDDVKVCDICGDAGLEEKLAICSRCSDGAEHTYCMRIMLDELPEGDWLCEECKLKEEKGNKEVYKLETTRASEVRSSSDHSEKIGTSCDPKLLPKLVTQPMDEEARETSKEQGNEQVSDKSHDANMEITSMATKKPSETIRKEYDFSHGSPFHNVDMGKVKPSKMASSYGDYLTNNLQPIALAQPSSLPNSSKIPAGLQSSRGSLSKSVSFNNSNMKPKVKHLTGTVPHMQTLAREYASSNTKKEGLVKEMARSTSLKSVSAGYSNVELISKIQPKSRWEEDTKDVKQVKEGHVREKKKISIIDYPLVSGKPPNASGIPLPNPDFRVAHASESGILGTGKGSEDSKNLGCNDVINQSAYIKSSSGPSSIGSCHSENEKPCQVVSNNDLHANSTVTDRFSRNPDTVAQRSAPHAVGLAHRDDKIKDPTFFSSSRQVVSCGRRILRCQRCNETGHSTQNCFIDKLRVTALKPSSDRNFKDRSDKSSKLKDAVDAAIPKITIQKSHRLATQTEKLIMPRPNMNFEVAPKNSLSISSFSVKNLPSLEGTTNGQENLRSTVVDPNKTGVVIDGKPQSIRQIGFSCVPRASKLNSAPIISDELTVKPTVQSFLDQASGLSRPFRASVIPELEFIWQGGFEVLRTGTLPELCGGIQAHLSTSVSRKVLQVATKFPCRVQVDEVPRLSSWPLQFQGNGPTEDNIALFFFAKDNESYEKNYRILLENMLQNDLVLKGHVDGVELLIFPSNKLPENSQRWNMLFFLWGVFRGQSASCLGTQPSSQEKPGDTSSTVQLLPSLSSDGLICPTMNLICPTMNSTENQDVELSMVDSLRSTNKHHSLYATELSSGMDIDVACLKNLICDSEGGKDAAAHVRACASNIKQDVGDSGSEKEHKLTEGEVILNDNLQEDVTEIYYLTGESSLDRKRARSASNCSTSYASGETIKTTGETTECSDKADCMSIDDEKQNKKMKLDSGGHAGLSSKEESSSGKVSMNIHPLSSGRLNNGVNNETLMRESSNAERHFFPVDLNLVRDAKPESLICIVSSDDEDSLESNTPDLELALGDEKKLPKQDLLPLLSPRICKRSNQDNVPDPSKNDRDDGLASLSLSLSFPPTE